MHYDVHQGMVSVVVLLILEKAATYFRRFTACLAAELLSCLAGHKMCFFNYGRVPAGHPAAMASGRAARELCSFLHDVTLAVSHPPIQMISHKARSELTWLAAQLEKAEPHQGP
jgi:hypothetical protein